MAPPSMIRPGKKIIRPGIDLNATTYSSAATIRTEPVITSSKRTSSVDFDPRSIEVSSSENKQLAIGSWQLATGKKTSFIHNFVVGLLFAPCSAPLKIVLSAESKAMHHCCG